MLLLLLPLLWPYPQSGKQQQHGPVKYTTPYAWQHIEKPICTSLDLIVAEPTSSQVHGFGEAFTEHVAPMGRPPSSDSVFCEGMPRSDGSSERRLIFIRVLMPLWLVALI